MVWSSKTEYRNFLRLTFYKEPDTEGYGGKPTTKTFLLDSSSIEMIVEYTDQNCTKICTFTGREIYVVETEKEIVAAMWKYSQ